MIAFQVPYKSHLKHNRENEAFCFTHKFPQWEAADAEIKVPSVENTELKGSPFRAWGRSAYSHACYAYCQGFLPY